MQHYPARASLLYWSLPDSVPLKETLFNANISMLLLKLLFSQALSYCRINPELREKWKATQTLLVWRDATRGKVTPRKAQTWRRNPLIYLSHTSCTPIRTFRWEIPCILKNMDSLFSHELSRKGSTGGKRASGLLPTITAGFKLRSDTHREMQSTTADTGHGHLSQGLRATPGTLRPLWAQQGETHTHTHTPLDAQTSWLL